MEVTEFRAKIQNQAYQNDFKNQVMNNSRRIKSPPKRANSGDAALKFTVDKAFIEMDNDVRNIFLNRVVYVKNQNQIAKNQNKSANNVFKEKDLNFLENNDG